MCPVYKSASSSFAWLILQNHGYHVLERKVQLQDVLEMMQLKESSGRLPPDVSI